MTPGKDPLDDQFSITLRADISGILRRKISRAWRRSFRGIAASLIASFPWPNPFIFLLPDGRNRGSRGSRSPGNRPAEAASFFSVRSTRFSLAEAETLAEEWKRTEEDFFLIVGTTHHVERQYQHLREILLPELREKHPGIFLFWIPAEIEEEEEAWMKEMLSAFLLLERYGEESYESGLAAKEFLQNFLKTGRKRLGEILTKAYFHGLLLWDDRQMELSPYGYLSQEKFLQEFIPPLLSRRFPKHTGSIPTWRPWLQRPSQVS